MTCEHCPWAYGKTYDENDKLRLVVCLPHPGGCEVRNGLEKPTDRTEK
jgi:hypothetical protein